MTVYSDDYSDRDADHAQCLSCWLPVMKYDMWQQCTPLAHPWVPQHDALSHVMVSAAGSVTVSVVAGHGYV